MQYKKSKFTYLYLIAIIALLMFGITLYAYFSNFNGAFSTVKGDWGTFGDFIGGSLNPIFGFLSLIAILYTIKIQTQELEYTREELISTKKELRGSKEAQEKQVENLKQQNFENTFFKLIDLHHKISDNAYAIFEKNQFVLHDIILEEDNDPFKIYTQKLGGAKSYRTTKNYYSFFRKHIKNVGSYFRNISQVLNLISEYDSEYQQKYSDIFRAQFSTLELEFLFFHAITYFEFKEVKKLIEKYAFLEPLTFDDLYRDEDILYYNLSAFGNPVKNNILNIERINTLRKQQNNNTKT